MPEKDLYCCFNSHFCSRLPAIFINKNFPLIRRSANIRQLAITKLGMKKLNSKVKHNLKSEGEQSFLIYKRCAFGYNNRDLYIHTDCQLPRQLSSTFCRIVGPKNYIKSLLSKISCILLNLN